MEAREKRVNGMSEEICPESKAKQVLNASALRKKNETRAVQLDFSRT
jgi:hypothetical protein